MKRGLRVRGMGVVFSDTSIKQKLVLVVAVVLAAVMVTVVVFAGVVRSESANLPEAAPPERIYLLSDEEIAQRQLALGDVVAKEEFAEGVFIEAGEIFSLSLNIPSAGAYELAAVYSSTERNLFENPVDITVDGTSFVSRLPFLWADDISNLTTDRYGNEILPQPYQLPYATSFLEDYESFTGIPLTFELASGEREISFSPQNQSLTLHGVYAVTPQITPTYEEYLWEYNWPEYTGELITIQGEDYRAKSDTAIRGASVTNSSLSPSSAYVKYLNATEERSNKTIGQKIYYEVSVPSDGFYYMSAKYSQPLKAGGDVYRTIEVDGKVPHEQLRDVGFNYTGVNVYRNMTVGGDTPYGIYLTAGIHTISFIVTANPVDATYKELLDIIDEINNTGLELMRVKGNTDIVTVDTNRTWDILQYMPDILDRLNGWISRLEDVYSELEQVSDGVPAYVSDLQLAIENLKRLANKPREIPNRLNLLSNESSSASQLASLALTKIYDQNLSFDCIYLHGENQELPPATENIFKRAVMDIKQFIYSFSPIMNDVVDMSVGGKTLTVWINKPFQYVELLRELTAEVFTEETGIDVTFSIMPEEGKLTMANATGNNPDAALGVSYYRPAEFAQRGMALNLLEFDDFIDWYGAEYNLEALTPMAFEDGIYGASETQDFFLLFYRTDILDMLHLKVPDTWDDVKAMMPVLQRNAMNFNLTMANNVGFKSLDTMQGFIFQYGGNYYTADGLSAGIGEPNTLKGLRLATDLYGVYGMQQNVPNFFNAFRSGSIPIGVSNFATYLQLQVGAPELNGRWDVAVLPGTKQEDGTIARYWGADTTAAMIFSNSEKQDEAYQFLKWWLSSETQLRYADNLQMKYGFDYIWNTANHVAMAGMPYPPDHKAVILEQWSWQKELFRHPATFILEREVSNAWIDIVTKGEDFQPRIDEAETNANAEIQRKLIEFGYLDQNGNAIRDFNMNIVSDIIAERSGESGSK
jgi:ABC-type glycerol-3-phosphate transport system substrate-binding protein